MTEDTVIFRQECRLSLYKMFKEMMNKQGITVMSNQQETTKNDQPDLKENQKCWDLKSWSKGLAVVFWQRRAKERLWTLYSDRTRYKVQLYRWEPWFLLYKMWLMRLTSQNEMKSCLKVPTGVSPVTNSFPFKRVSGRKRNVRFI